jgi:O-acetyl-ADP-ribose deacetylase (regulator of RNase III)
VAAVSAGRVACELLSHALALATRHGVASIAYPAISTGAFGFPPDRAASIAMKTVLAALGEGTSVERIVFCCFGADSLEHHHNAFAATAPKT